MTAYSGYLTRLAHFSRSNDVVPGVNPEHTHPEPDPDPFDPRPDTPDYQAHDAWMPVEDGFASGESVQDIRHWYDGQLSVPSNVPYGVGQQAMQERMMADHAPVNYRRDSIRLYQHESEGNSIEYVPGRMPQNAGSSLPEDVQYLANGRNSYDQINQPNEVYAGDPANVGRYRVGAKINMFGLYNNPLGKFGQDALLRAYTGLTPMFPDNKTQHNQTAAPYTPNSSGTATWVMPQYQDISTFTLPSETAMSDFTTGNAQVSETDFNEGDRL
jgi:hypothetical protein